MKTGFEGTDPVPFESRCRKNSTSCRCERPNRSRLTTPSLRRCSFLPIRTQRRSAHRQIVLIHCTQLDILQPSDSYPVSRLRSSSTFEYSINRIHVDMLLNVISPTIEFSAQLGRDEFGSMERTRRESFPGTCAIQPAPAKPSLIE